MSQGIKKPFTHVIKANIGDAHAMGQVPITFIRQVLVCISYPEIIKQIGFPEDVKERARQILDSCSGGSIGSYSAPYGIDHIRRHVAEYIEQRDGQPAHWQNVFLSAGASTAIKYCLQLFSSDMNGQRNAVLTPIPQYPLYSACYAKYGLTQIGYYLDETANWSLSIEELERRLFEANGSCKVRVLVVINPGNPTGQVLTRHNIEEIIKFVYKHNLFLLADEVYQHNVYAEDSQFFSFKKVMMEMGAPYSSIELASIMSVSKGYMGECGLRGGWLELTNIQSDVQAQLYKFMAAMVSPNILGQAAIDCMAKPPSPGDPSYNLWLCEKTSILTSLKKRATMITEGLRSVYGFKCNTVQGALYAFPSLTLPPKAMTAAKAADQPLDVFYAYRLLEETGICVVPGTGFDQAPGTFHIRLTILPDVHQLEVMMDTIKSFNRRFIKRYT